MANNQKIKYIHRTIVFWTGVEVVVDIANRTFKEEPRIWYDEMDIPRGRAEKVQKHEKMYRMPMDYFMAHAELIDEKNSL